MRRKRHHGCSPTRHTGRRTLRAEHLEKRELLAADFPYAGVPIGPAGNKGGVGQADSVLVDVENCVPQANEFGVMLRAGGTSQANGAGGAGPQPGGPVDADAATVRGTLTPEEALGVLQLREEEKLARDVYLAFDQMSPVFSSIAQAESRHMDAVGQLIVRYGLEDPAGDNPEGVFTNPDFTQLYLELVDAGSESLTAAYKVGAMIEEMDILDLQVVSSTVTNRDVARVYENLTRGSRNHLRAFAAQIEAAGETYEAQYLSQEEFDEIANSPMERGNGQTGPGRQGQVAADVQPDDVDEPLRLRDRFGDVDDGSQTRLGDRDRDGDGDCDRDGDRQRDRDRDCISQEDPDGDISQQIADRDRLFANLGA